MPGGHTVGTIRVMRVTLIKELCEMRRNKHRGKKTVQRVHKYLKPEPLSHMSWSPDALEMF